jgi:methylenetetrahydrofolate dehydrogenase (NADP+) / methenyltetrahydrofolate cyclohydrolase
MTARLIDGKLIAADVRQRITGEVARLVANHSFRPGLAVVLVGNDPASEVYVRSKARQTARPGWRHSSTRFRRM